MPFIVRDPYQAKRGLTSPALVSHIDIAPSLLDFAGGLDPQINGPTKWVDPGEFWDGEHQWARDNRNGRNKFRAYQGKSWLPILGDPDAEHHLQIFASHTFHEITMYYPMRAVRDRKYKLIWNIAHRLEYPFATVSLGCLKLAETIPRRPGCSLRAQDGQPVHPSFQV